MGDGAGVSVKSGTGVVSGVKHGWLVGELKGVEETLSGRTFRQLILSDLKKKHPVGAKFSKRHRQSPLEANKGKSHEKKSLFAVRPL